MTQSIRGLQDLTKSNYQDALIKDGVVLQIDTGDGQATVTFTGKPPGDDDMLTATGSFENLSVPTFSGLTQIVKNTAISTLAKADIQAAVTKDATDLKVVIDTKHETITQIVLEVDPDLSKLLGDSSLPGGLKLSNVSLTIDPQKKSYSFTCDADGGWTIVKGFSLDKVGLKVEGTTSASPAITLDADVSIAGVGISFSAERAADSANEGKGDQEESDAAKAPAWKFSGQLQDKQTISLSSLIQDIENKLGVTVPSFGEASLDKLVVDFDTGTQDFSFTCDSDAIGAIDLDIGVAEGSAVFTYHTPKGADINIKDLVTKVSPSLGSEIPTKLSLTVKDAVFVRTGGAASKLFFAIDTGGAIDLSSLSGLPLVGSALAGGKAVKLSYQIVAASDAFTADEVKALQKQLGDKYTTVPATIPKGVNVGSSLKIGDETLNADLPLDLNKSTDDVVAQNSGSGTQWFKLQKSIGPLHLDQVGVQYKDGELELLLKASMALGGLSISLDGLGIASPLNPVKPTPFLDGMGIAYKTDALEIGGAFLRDEDTDHNVSYEGAAVLQASVGGNKLGLHAIGSYASLNGTPSLFLYAFLDFPLGGPPFFFVEGLAAGFGYNRSLTVPDLDGIADFPLVLEAMGEVTKKPDTTDVASLAATLATELDKLKYAIKPCVGAGFLAIGVKFNSFKMIDSFALATVELGDRFEMDLLGVSKLSVPPNGEEGVEPLAELRMILKASFVPSDGFLGVIAALDKSSYILSKQCTLTGGFAFYAWFAGPHAGDFVITLGGYNPSFNVPSHYPQVPRLGFNWRVDDTIVLKGEAYFALCGHALMAGGYREASYQSGSVHASFTVGADVLISWKPYHYDIDAYVSISAGCGIFSAHVGADLHIWGPAFGGEAKIKIVVVSVTIKFGDQGSTSPTKLDWDKFKTSFLPADANICAITVQSGLVRQLLTPVEKQDEHVYVVNPKQFAIATDSFFPTNKAIVGDAPPPGVTYPPFGIRPMGVSASDLTSQHTITIKHYDDSGTGWTSCESAFLVTPLRKKAPSGIWGKPNLNGDQVLPPSANDPRFVTDDSKDPDPVSGFQITPAKQPTPGATKSIPKSKLRYTTVNSPLQGWQTLPLFRASTSDDTTLRATLRKSVKTNSKRDTILKALGYSPAEDVQIDPIALDASLVITPQVQVA